MKFDSVPPIGGTQYKFQPWNRDSGIETLARVPSARPFPSARPLSAERLFSQCLFHYILVCYHMLCYNLFYCTILQYVAVVYYVLRMCFFVLILCHVIFHYVSSGDCVTSWFRFCYVLLCSVMFSYMLFHLVRLYYVMLWYIL